MEKTRKILITAALPYANGPIHLGHMVEYLQADFWSRFQKMRGHECHYFCADDTHGTPIMVRAMKEGIKPEQIIEKSYKDHLADFTEFGVDFTHFSSTNSKDNKELCEKIYISMRDAGHSQIRSIQQTYCEHDKMFLPDRFVKGACPKCDSPDQYGDSCDNCGATYSPTDMTDSHCVICGNTPVMKDSDHVFITLNNFKSFLKEWVPKHNSEEVTKKLNEWLEEDLRDWDISRDKPYFGFEIPGLEGKYFYVWVDAPVGYIATSKEWCEKNGQDYMDFWKPDSEAEVYHFIGKDIIYFHSIFWPAMLKGSGFRTPTQVCADGFLTVNGAKMSKSKGTFIMARTYLDHLDPSYLRYYYGCKLSNDLNDVDLNLEDFAQRVNSDLVGKFINIGSRSAKILSTQFESQLTQDYDEQGKLLVKELYQEADAIATDYENRDFSKALVRIRNLADKANKYFDEKAPWKMVKEDKDGAHKALSVAMEVFRVLAIYLQPVIPEVSNKVAQLFGQESFMWSDIEKTASQKVNSFSHLLKRLDIKLVQKMVEDSQPKEDKKASKDAQKKAKKESKNAEKTAKKADDGYADIKDFQKLDLRIGEVLSAEEVPDSNKMMKLMVSLGEDKPRTIFSGIKNNFSAEQLEGQKVLVVANLKPRKMKFGVSEGMVLLAGDDKDLFLVTSSDSQPGLKVE